jgi:hypothetical protein
MRDPLTCVRTIGQCLFTARPSGTAIPLSYEIVKWSEEVVNQYEQTRPTTVEDAKLSAAVGKEIDKCMAQAMSAP